MQIERVFDNDSEVNLNNFVLNKRYNRDFGDKKSLVEYCVVQVFEIDNRIF
jgi:hypothetical protein